jgi:hypothetical protein
MAKFSIAPAQTARTAGEEVRRGGAPVKGERRREDRPNAVTLRTLNCEEGSASARWPFLNRCSATARWARTAGEVQ